jgi:hypothetical protein
MMIKSPISAHVRHHHTLMFLCALWLLVIGCSPSIPEIPIQGELGGQPINTTVDSDIARYYFENYLQNIKTDSELDTTLDQVHSLPSTTLPDQEALASLSRTYSVDFATLYLMKRILEHESTPHILSTFLETFAMLKRAGDIDPGIFFPEASSYLFLFAPSWLYKTNPYTGADFAKIRKLLDELGLHTQLIDTEESGAVETNARIIAEELFRLQSLDKQIILISASKSGPEVAQALGELLPAEQTSHIKAWLNIGGVLRGSPVADALLRWPTSWNVRSHFSSKGWDITGLESVTTKRSQQRFQRLTFPAHLLIINYIGIPLSGNINEGGWKGYLKLRKKGPNDGRTLILDAIVPGGIIIPQLGFDHYFRDPDMEFKVAALLQTLLQYFAASHECIPD